MRITRALVVLAGTLLLGCSTRPTPVGEKVLTLFVDRDYRGSWHDVFADIGNLKDVPGPCGGDSDSAGTFDDCISSIRVTPGWAVTLYRDRGWSGPAFEITADTADLKNLPGSCERGFDDCVSSLRVRQLQ